MKTFKNTAEAMEAVVTIQATPKGMEAAMGAFTFLEQSNQKNAVELRNARVKAIPVCRQYFDGSTEETTFNTFLARILGFSDGNKDGNTQVKNLIKLNKIAVKYPQVLDRTTALPLLVGEYVNVKDENGKSVNGEYRPKTEQEAELAAKFQALSPLEQLQARLREVQSELKRKNDALKNLQDAIAELHATEADLQKQMQKAKAA